MRVTLLAAAAGLASLGAGREAFAEEPERAAPSTPPAPLPAANLPSTSDDLTRELLAPEPGEEDLEWLYSNADEYEPGTLGGGRVPAPSLPQRGEGARRTWNPAWRRFGVLDYVLTATSVAFTGVGAAWSPLKNHWTSHNAFDESVRRQLSARSYAGSIIAQDTSDLLLSVSIAYPALVQSLVVTYWYRRSEDVAAQMLLIATESLTFTAALQGMTSTLASRERPYGRECGAGLPGRLNDCASSRRYRSFFSGHTSTSFAAAATACSFQFHHDVFGNATANGIACASALATAAATGTLRIAGDQHYATDVLTGAAVGMLGGFGLPWLLHYGPLARVERKGERATGVKLSLVPVSGGLGVGGEF